jgi:hypothetical protein
MGSADKKKAKPQKPVAFLFPTLAMTHFLPKKRREKIEEEKSFLYLAYIDVLTSCSYTLSI